MQIKTTVLFVKESENKEISVRTDIIPHIGAAIRITTPSQMITGKVINITYSYEYSDTFPDFQYSIIYICVYLE